MLAGGGQTELVEAGGRGEIGCGESGVGHVEVFRDGYCWAVSIMGGSRPLSREAKRRTGLGWRVRAGRLHAQLEEPLSLYREPIGFTGLIDRKTP